MLLLELQYSILSKISTNFVNVHSLTLLWSTVLNRKSIRYSYICLFVCLFFVCWILFFFPRVDFAKKRTELKISLCVAHRVSTKMGSDDCGFRRDNSMLLNSCLLPVDSTAIMVIAGLINSDESVKLKGLRCRKTTWKAQIIRNPLPLRQFHNKKKILILKPRTKENLTIQQNRSCHSNGWEILNHGLR